MWSPTRQVLDTIDYSNKNVLDLASWDGMWAFEAEKRGAAQVVATDARFIGYSNLLFAREVLQSNVIPLCNVPIQDLENRLNIIEFDGKFDIVHHLGLFYHLRDPLLSLTQVRKILKPNGIVVLETACIDDEENSYMLFSGLPGNHHFYGISDTWAPTKLCLRETLIRSFLEPINESTWKYLPGSKIKFCNKEFVLGRITMVAQYSEEGHSVDNRKVFGTQ